MPGFYLYLVPVPGTCTWYLVLYYYDTSTTTTAATLVHGLHGQSWRVRACKSSYRTVCLTPMPHDSRQLELTTPAATLGIPGAVWHT